MEGKLSLSEHHAKTREKTSLAFRQVTHCSQEYLTLDQPASRRKKSSSLKSLRKRVATMSLTVTHVVETLL